jgi:phosphoglucosamine mutase
VIIGKDTRVSGYMFESALEAGLVAAGVDVKLLGPDAHAGRGADDPHAERRCGHRHQRLAQSLLRQRHQVLLRRAGAKLPDADELAIEAELAQPLANGTQSHDIGKVLRLVDAAGRYIEFCKSTVPEGFSLRGMRIAVDCAHGATYHDRAQRARRTRRRGAAHRRVARRLQYQRGVGSTDMRARRD